MVDAGTFDIQRVLALDLGTSYDQARALGGGSYGEQEQALVPSGTLNLVGTDGTRALPLALAGTDRVALPLPAVAIPALPGYETTDSKDDRHHWYVTPFPKGHELRIINRHR